MSVRQPTVFLDGLVPAASGSLIPDDVALPDRLGVERVLLERALQPFLTEVAGEREHQNDTIRRHVEISLQTLIDRQNLQLADYLNRQIEGQTVPGIEGLISQVEGHLDRLNERLEGRLRELEMERHCTIADMTHLGRAWVLPHPERTTPALAPMVRDAEIERIAVEFATRHEEARGWQVESVESENRGFDLISRRAHPEDPKTFVEVRFIEVKGRAGVGEIALTANELRPPGGSRTITGSTPSLTAAERRNSRSRTLPGSAGCRWSRSSTTTWVRGNPRADPSAGTRRRMTNRHVVAIVRVKLSRRLVLTRTERWLQEHREAVIAPKAEDET